MMELRSARMKMVDSQVRPNQVNDPRVIAAMRALPREAFVPAGTNPYVDMDICLGHGRFLLAPMVIARLVQAVLTSNPASVLVIGCGTGYGAALIAGSGAKVVALEDDALFDMGGLAKFAPAVTHVSGPLATGWGAAAPYDVIFIEGAVCEIPLNLAAQLHRHGRLVTILAQSKAASGLGSVVIAEPSQHGFATRRIFDCTARILPAFQPVPAFEF